MSNHERGTALATERPADRATAGAETSAASSAGGNEHVCVLGVYGNGNLGDDALLLSIVERVHGVAPETVVVALCSDPDLVEGSYGITALSRSPSPHFLKKLGLVRTAKAIIIGGGTLVCDHGRLGDTILAQLAVLFWPLIGRAFGVPTMVYAQGLGPAESGLVRWIIRHVLSRAAAITFRDAASQELYRRIAGTRSCPGHGAVACDPAVASMLFEPAAVRERVGDALDSRLGQERPFCLVSLGKPKLTSVQDRADYFGRCARTLAEAYRERPKRLLLFPCLQSRRGEDDRDALRVVAAALLREGVPQGDIALGGWERLDEAIATVQQADVVFADRLHALVFALMAGVPVIGIQVEDKIPGCLRMVGVGEPAVAVLQPGELGTAKALRALCGAWGARACVGQDIRRGIREWIALDERSAQSLEALIR